MALANLKCETKTNHTQGRARTRAFLPGEKRARDYFIKLYCSPKIDGTVQKARFWGETNPSRFGDTHLLWKDSPSQTVAASEASFETGSYSYSDSPWTAVSVHSVIGLSMPVKRERSSISPRGCASCHTPIWRLDSGLRHREAWAPVHTRRPGLPSTCGVEGSLYSVLAGKRGELRSLGRIPGHMLEARPEGGSGVWN